MLLRQSQNSSEQLRTAETLTTSLCHCKKPFSLGIEFCHTATPFDTTRTSSALLNFTRLIGVNEELVCAVSVAMWQCVVAIRGLRLTLLVCLKYPLSAIATTVELSRVSVIGY